jgi:hypothetical protein
VLGIFEENSIETMQRRRIEILKGRGGEKGRFFTRWDWIGMRFDEILPESVEELHF